MLDLIRADAIGQHDLVGCDRLGDVRVLCIDVSGHDTPAAAWQPRIDRHDDVDSVEGRRADDLSCIGAGSDSRDVVGRREVAVPAPEVRDVNRHARHDFALHAE